MKLTDKQRDNWRRVMASGPIGPFAWDLTDEEVERIAERIQAQIDEFETLDTDDQLCEDDDDIRE